MPLPVSDWLSLQEAVKHVIEATGESEARIREALTAAGLAGELIATGCSHLSYLRNLDKYFAHPALNEREPVPPDDWGLTISWEKSRIGRFDLVRLNRADIERWLAVPATYENEQPSEQSLSPRPKKKTKQTKVDDIAACLRERFSKRPAMKIDELMREVKQQAPSVGNFSPRTLERAIAKAWPRSA
jgi:hypothetical protein